MIDKQILQTEIEKNIEGTGLFLAPSVSTDNRIVVEIDSARGVDIEDCTRLSRQIEQAFDRDVEDYELEVGSAGLTAPFKVRGQFEKNIGNDIDVLTRDGRKLSGVLDGINPEGTVFTFTVKEKVKEPGKKRPVIAERQIEMAVADTKSVRYAINFK